LVFGAAVVGATSAAFAGGSHLRHRNADAAPLDPVRVVQARDGASLARVAPGNVGGGNADIGVGTYETVYEFVRRNYVDPLPGDTKMAHGTVKAMIATLEDPNSFYLEPAQKALFDGEAAGRYSGIGAALYVRSFKHDGYTDHKIVVVAPLPGSPAEKAGVRAGDIITRVNGKWILGYNPLVSYMQTVQKVRNGDASEDELRKVVESAQTKIRTGVSFLPAQLFLRGDKSVAALTTSPKVMLTLERAGNKEPITVEVTPAETRVEPVVSKTIDSGAYYIKVATFTDETTAAAKQALAAVPATAPGIILDLRGNPGGSIDAAQGIFGQLAGAGTMAVEIGVKGKRTPIAAGGRPVTNLPVTVLIDRGTASTAEMLAAGLADSGRGTLAGQATFGDAVSQTLYALGDGTAFTLTTAKLASPKGVSWAGTGLQPQVAITPGTAEDQVLARAVAALKERPRVARSTSAPAGP
jgi:carboxyl-terminal processing protease